MSIISLIIKENVAKVQIFIVMTFKSAAVCVLPHLWVSKFDESRNETKIHDESGLFVKEFIAQNNLKVNTNILIYL
jgi:ABC-2 type transport system permease protein